MAAEAEVVVTMLVAGFLFGKALVSVLHHLEVVAAL